MKLFEIDSNKDSSLSQLKELLDTTGNCIMNGYLGEEFTSFRYDEDGNFTYTTDYEKEDNKIHSEGVLLPSGLLIKQTQDNHGIQANHLYSWNLEQPSYTFLSFDYSDNLNHYFDVLKRFDVCLGDEEDISLQFQNMGLSFDPIERILVNQSTDPLHQMFDDFYSKGEKEKSYLL